MNLNPRIDASNPSKLYLVWDKDLTADGYVVIAPDGSRVQVGKKANTEDTVGRVALGAPKQPFQVSVAGLHAGPFEATVFPVAPPPPPPPPPPTGVPRAGISVGGKSLYRSDADQKFELDQIASLGAKVVRVDVAKGSEAQVDRFVAGVQARGMEPLLILGGWLNSPPSYDWRAFVASVRDRYVPKGVRLFETSNEPNIVNYPANVYAANCIVAYEEIKKAAGTIMATGALSLPASSILSYASTMFANGVGGHFDAFSVHAYNAANDHGSWSAWDVTFGHPTYYPGDNNVVGLMHTHGGVKPVWITECGDNSDKQGLDYQSRAVRTAITDPRPQLSTVYTLLDDDVSGFGLLDDNRQPRPSYAAYKAAV